MSWILGYGISWLKLLLLKVFENILGFLPFIKKSTTSVDKTILDMAMSFAEWNEYYANIWNHLYTMVMHLKN